MDWSEIGQYALLFVLAAAPWLEVFLVIPLGIAWGLHPVAVGVIGFVGNWIPVLIIAALHQRITAWMRRRRARKEGISEAAAEAFSATKMQRARKLWEKYGIPGFALLAPAIIGTDIAALLAFAFGTRRGWIVAWLTVSLVAWTLLLTFGAYYGLGYMGWLSHS